MLLVAGGLLLGGLVKGVLGIGLPLVAVPILSYVLTVPQVIAILAVPILVGNAYQALASGHLAAAFGRFWPLMLAQVVGAVLGAWLLAGIDSDYLYVFAGLAVALFAGISLGRFTLRLAPRHETWVGVTVGALAGAMGSVSSMFGPPIILYMMALQLERAEFMRAIALAYLAGPVASYVSLTLFGTFSGEDWLASGVAVAPVLCGMAVGRFLGAKLPQETFRKIVLGVLVLIGLNLARRGLGL